MFRPPVLAFVLLPLCVAGAVLGLWQSTRSDTASVSVLQARQSDYARESHARNRGDSLPAIRVSDFPPPTPGGDDTATAQGTAPTPRMNSDWPAAVLENPDPRARRLALEQWARNPTAAVNFVAAAMVDPDESIRERAAQIFEEALASRHH